jgi:hypothetical protein
LANQVPTSGRCGTYILKSYPTELTSKHKSFSVKGENNQLTLEKEPSTVAILKSGTLFQGNRGYSKQICSIKAI